MDQPESEVTQPSKPCRLPLSALQKPNTHIRRVTLRFRRQLESAVLERGPLGIGQAALIHKAVISLRTAALIERILGQVGMPGYTAVHEETQLDGTVIRKSKGLTHPEYVAYTDR